MVLIYIIKNRGDKMKWLKYFTIALFFFISLVFIFTLSRGDTFVNFGFSYAISKGQIPYKDFNMVISPFGPIIYSIGLLLCKNIIVYYLEQAILLTVMIYYVEKIINKKWILFLLCLIIPYPVAFVSVIYPGYNFLILLLFIMFIYYFKKDNNYLLGVLLGLIFCTKQTIGIVLFIPTIYYLFKDRKKFKEMTIGYLIPIFVLLIYLLITGSLYNFIDLCFLGLLDFNNSNSGIDIFYFILFILGLIYIIYKTIKDKKNILMYYVLLFSSVVLPIIDYYHVSLFLIIVVLFIIKDLTINNKLYKYIYLFIGLICIIWSYISVKFLDPLTITNYNNFSLVINTKEYSDTSKKLLKYTDSLDKEVIFFMRGSENYFYKIINNKKLNYFDLPNYGNYGYNGVNKMMKKINKKHNVYFVIDKELIVNENDNQQYIKELGQEVIKKSELVKTIGLYEIYYKK